MKRGENEKLIDKLEWFHDTDSLSYNSQCSHRFKVVINVSNKFGQSESDPSSLLLISDFNQEQS